MAQIKLKGFEQKEIPNVSGKGISFKKISIPGEDCSNFYIQFEIRNPINNSTFSGPIHCTPSIYQRDTSKVSLYKSEIVPDNCILKIRIESIMKSSFIGESIIDFEIFPIDELNKKSGIKVFISEDDRQYAFRIALLNLVRFFNIPYNENDNNNMLYEKINSSDNIIIKKSNIKKLLEDYFCAYDQWFNFYARKKEIEFKTNQPLILSNDEKIELDSLINNRESSLNALQIEFDKLQFEEFKKKHGLENVEGIGL